jgi:hypothetical protein
MTKQHGFAPSNASSAIISVCGAYRYVLRRQLGPSSKAAAFILLNPSTADAEQNDPTIRRCMGFARRWGCGQLTVLNLFAFRATFPADLKQAADPVGRENQEWLGRCLAEFNGPVVCGWGVHGSDLGQDFIVLRLLDQFGIKPLALGLTKQGHPKHPLYVPYDAELVPFLGRRP